PPRKGPELFCVAWLYHFRSLSNQSDHHHCATAKRSAAFHFSGTDPERGDPDKLSRFANRDAFSALARQLDSYCPGGDVYWRGPGIDLWLRPLALSISWSEHDVKRIARYSNVPRHDAV